MGALGWVQWSGAAACALGVALVSASCGGTGNDGLSIGVDASTFDGPSFSPEGIVCTPRTCAGSSYTCGWNGDGCGGTIQCGACGSPEFCGGGGFSRCGDPPPDGGSACVPRTCAEL